MDNAFEPDPRHQYAAVLDAMEAVINSLKESGYETNNTKSAVSDLVTFLEGWGEKHLKRVL